METKRTFEINIDNYSKLLRMSKKKRETIIDCIIYILTQEKKRGNKLFKKFCEKISIKQMQINLLFIDEKEMISYNHQYFGRNYPTDVIAFSMIEGEVIENSNQLGDALICISTALENAREYNHSFEEELVLLIIHSILHLIGYEHEDEQGIMRKKEKKYFNYIKMNILK